MRLSLRLMTREPRGEELVRLAEELVSYLSRLGYSASQPKLYRNRGPGYRVYVDLWR